MRITFIFGTNLDSRIVTVQGATMKRAMHSAAKQLGVREINLVFIRVVEKLAA